MRTRRQYLVIAARQFLVNIKPVRLAVGPVSGYRRVERSLRLVLVKLRRVAHELGQFLQVRGVSGWGCARACQPVRLFFTEIDIVLLALDALARQLECVRGRLMIQS